MHIWDFFCGLLVLKYGNSALGRGIAVRNGATESYFQVIGERITVVLIRQCYSGALLQQAVHSVLRAIFSGADGICFCRIDRLPKAERIIIHIHVGNGVAALMRGITQSGDLREGAALVRKGSCAALQHGNNRAAGDFYSNHRVVKGLHINRITIGDNPGRNTCADSAAVTETYLRLCRLAECIGDDICHIRFSIAYQPFAIRSVNRQFERTCGELFMRHFVQE